MDQIRTDVTGVNWQDALNANKELTVAQQCRYEQDVNDPSRVTFCTRCGHATGSYQGHYWKWCRKRPETLGAIVRGEDNGVEFHVCCPGSCSLDDPDPDPVQPCHPAPGTYKEWAAGVRVERENYAKWQDVLRKGGHL